MLQALKKLFQPHPDTEAINDLLRQKPPHITESDWLYDECDRPRWQTKEGKK